MRSLTNIDMRLLSLLACPRDHTELRFDSGSLSCAQGHTYRIVSGIPVFLLSEKEQTIRIANESLRAAENAIGGPLYIDTLGLSEEEKRGIERDWISGKAIDPAISYLIGATSGLGYTDLIGRLESYPIPSIPIGTGNGGLLLDIGSSWGRWSVSAARKGWRVIGIDPSLGAILAAKRAFSDIGLKMDFVCGDARFLPFKADVFQTAFSYSVMQHLSKADVELCITELSRVLCRGGISKIQMAHKGGLRSKYVSARESLNTRQFRVRYWSLSSLRDVFEKKIGPSTLIAESFGGLGLLAEDRKFVSTKVKVLIGISTLIKTACLFVPPLINLADSVYVVSTKR